MHPFPVVEDLDVLEAGSLHLGMSGITDPMHPLVLDTAEPALGGGIVPAVALPTHRTGHAVLPELVLDGVAGVLDALVQMMQ